IRVDPVRRTARAEGGTTWGDFDRETQAFGLATTGGVVSSTGIAGLTLGGGLGWLAGKYGLACDNLIAADIVTADCQLRHVSASEHPDLFWGLRGGGGNFGVVTSFAYQLHPVGPVLAGIVLYPFTKAKEALTVYRDFATACPHEGNTIGALLTSPDGVPLVAIGGCYNRDLDAREQVLRPLRAFGPPWRTRSGRWPTARCRRCSMRRLSVGSGTTSNRILCSRSATARLTSSSSAFRLFPRPCPWCTLSNWVRRRIGWGRPPRPSAIATRCAIGAAMRSGWTRRQMACTSRGRGYWRRPCGLSPRAATT